MAVAGCAEHPHASLPLRHGFDPRATTQTCLRHAHLASVPVGPRQLLLGAGPDGPSIVFTITTAEAEAIELRGEAEGAERVGSALLFVRGASEAVLAKVESCLKKQDSLTLSTNS